MKLYLVGPVDHGNDEYDSFVVRAESEEQARKIAHEETIHPFGGQPAFLYADVTEITADGESGAIIGSFNAG